MKTKNWTLPNAKHSEPLDVNSNFAFENHEYIFELLTKVSPSSARELIIQFIDDYLFLKKGQMKELGYNGRHFPFDIQNSLEYLKSMAEALMKITVVKENDGFVFDNYKPFLEIISDNGFCENISNELNLILLDYTILKIRELSVEPNRHRAQSAFDNAAFMSALTDGVSKIRFIPTLDA
ncbi:MAG: hypothetical protein KF856_14275 [Cyclobacteriaceae bacterium]|nr:hypothetical protein [Cyclobacteriaceae bacterium]